MPTPLCFWKPLWTPLLELAAWVVCCVLQTHSIANQRLVCDVSAPPGTQSLKTGEVFLTFASPGPRTGLGTLYVCTKE